MTYQKFQPNETLSQYVECYFNWHCDKPLDNEFIVESPPNSFCSLVINYGDPYFLQNKNMNAYRCQQSRLEIISSRILFFIFSVHTILFQKTKLGYNELQVRTDYRCL